jgi:hypothetical protein
MFQWERRGLPFKEGKLAKSNITNSGAIFQTGTGVLNVLRHEIKPNLEKAPLNFLITQLKGYQWKQKICLVYQKPLKLISVKLSIYAFITGIFCTIYDKGSYYY